MDNHCRLYPPLYDEEHEPSDSMPPVMSDRSSDQVLNTRYYSQDDGPNSNANAENDSKEDASNLNDLFSTLQLSQIKEHKSDIAESTADNKQDKYFYYDPPHYEETGIWMPVSVPPLSKSEHEEWSKGFSNNSLYLGNNNFFDEENTEMTMWDVFSEMLVAAGGRAKSLAMGEIRRSTIAFISENFLEQAWKDMSNTLTEADFGNAQEILETDPPKWLADSAAASCMLCGSGFHPIMCSRHHCRFCGGVFCGQCTRGRSLLPPKFRAEDPQRVCDVCGVRLKNVEPYLMNQISRACQLPTKDVTNLSTLRSWLNFPWGQSMEYEIYKAANIIRDYNKIGLLKPEKTIPEAVLKQAKGLAILTVAKVGLMVTYNVGTGLVIARREDGSWSPPSAISTFGLGWGAQVGGNFTDFIIVLRNTDAIRTFCGNAHVSVGAGVGAAAGIVGRAAEADFRAGDGGYAACYTYSCSKGAFVGCALQGSMVMTRVSENCRFYGSSSIQAMDILLGSMPKPPAAAILYQALSDLARKFNK